ncbi:MAG: hypothetical protein A3F12_02800 [Gammaproteobacteria bacterium RIFCSPHIGHO2_12_FULL_38_14]|nr:MAG: hypothetical protein A3F12_02800 [Gammaproteobacteria bacterium RIFCSPHIGHO2_12_FULL_38_14]
MESTSALSISKKINYALEKKFGESTDGYMKRIISTIELFYGKKTYHGQIIAMTDNMISGFAVSLDFSSSSKLLRERIINQFFGGNYLGSSMYEFAKENASIFALVHTTRFGFLGANEEIYKKYEDIYQPMWGESYEGYKNRALDGAQDLLKQ